MQTKNNLKYIAKAFRTSLTVLQLKALLQIKRVYKLSSFNSNKDLIIRP